MIHEQPATYQIYKYISYKLGVNSINELFSYAIKLNISDYQIGHTKKFCFIFGLMNPIDKIDNNRRI